MADTPDTAQQEAARYGLSTLAEQYPTQFNTARAAAARFVTSVPRDLSVTVEPAHIFRASQEA